MNTKNILKTLALAMLLATACNKSEIANDENAEKKGFALPVTVNVTREGDDATKATYDDGTKKLSFSAGDKLFVNGSHTAAGQFAGTLDYDAVSGKFSGTIYTESEYTGTAEALLAGADDLMATLLPAGYDTYGYLSIKNEGSYGAYFSRVHNKAFALTKKAAVEQFSVEHTISYSSGFALAPDNAIVSFTISGLTANKEVAVSFDREGTGVIGGNVTTSATGVATFAVGVYEYCELENCTLTVDGNNIALPTKTTEAGHIYNITRSAAPALTYPIALSAVTSDYVGSVVTTDGNVYATVAAASAAIKTAVAVIAYVGTAGSVDASSDTYKGLAIALSDANSGSNCKWAESFEDCLSSIGGQDNTIATALGFKNGITCTSTLTSDGHTHAAATAAASNNGTAAPTGTSGWFMPSMGQWNLIVQGLATKKAGSAVTTNLEKNTDNDTYKADNLNSVITDAGGTGFKTNSYSASTESTFVSAWAIHFTYGYATSYAKTTDRYVRSVIAF